MNGRELAIAIVPVEVGLGVVTGALRGLILNGQSQMNSDIHTLQEAVVGLRKYTARLEGRVDRSVEVFTNREDSQ